MKYLKPFNESVNPDRISDSKFRIYLERIGIEQDGPFDKQNKNLFYLNNIIVKDSGDDFELEYGEHNVEMTFYNPILSNSGII